MMKQQELIPHLFRSEFSRITSVLCRHFSITHIEVAEDIASETFLAAIETWTYKGIPENPAAWLYAVAKNKAANYIKRSVIFKERVTPRIETGSSQLIEKDIDLSEENITDSQLQMLFAICNPAIPIEAQIGLALRILCGFGPDEIANAFLTNKETINKRLFRAKEKLRSEKITLEFPSGALLNNRLEAVLTTLYLLFNEGYYSESRDAVLREDLCVEAMRLTYMLIQNQSTNLPQVNALFALMCFHSSRFEARKTDNGEMVYYKDQDVAKWNYELIEKGAWHLHQSSVGNSISKYHIEAGIAYWHTKKEDTDEKWNNILNLYDCLLQIAYSPAAALNRIFALSKVNGNKMAIKEAELLNLQRNLFYHLLLGELYFDVNKTKAREYYEKAYSLARTHTERQTILKKLESFNPPD